MFARALLKKTLPAVARASARTPVAIRAFSAKTSADSKDIDVIVPELVDTLEWVLDSPPNVHQFEEPPIIVEIEHLKNLAVPDDE